MIRVNDSLGHDVGDALLREVVKRIRPVIRESDIFARLGGDEFIIVLTDIVQDRELSAVIDRITSYNVCYTKLLRKASE